jgi:hypothetical protein
METDSTNLHAPDFRQSFPTYPVHTQVARVSGAAVISSIFPGFIQQANMPTVTLRDREACYVWEPNGAALATGYYICRVVGNYTSGGTTLPLLATVQSAGSNHYEIFTVCCDLELGCSSDTCSFVLNFNDYTFITVNKPVYVGGPGPFIFNTPVEICGFQFWCCLNYTAASGSFIFTPPQAATIYTWNTSAGNDSLLGIVPYAAVRLIQSSSSDPIIHVGPVSITSRDTTLVKAIQSGDQLLVWAEGVSPQNLYLSSASMKVTDNQGMGLNTYVQDEFSQDTVSGAFAGIWRCANPMSTSDTFTITFAYTGTGGVFDVGCNELYGLQSNALDQTNSTIGMSIHPSAGGVTPTTTYQYHLTVFGSDNTNDPVTITQPVNYSLDFEQTNGSVYAPGAVAYEISGSTSSETPTFTTDSAANWAAVIATYKGQALPQLLAIVNEGPNNITVEYGEGSGDGASIAAPGHFVENIYSSAQQLVVYPNDTVVFWYDVCTSGNWIILFTTALPNWTLLAFVSSEIAGGNGGTQGAIVEVYANVGGGVVDTGIALQAYNVSWGAIPAASLVTLNWEPSGRTWTINFAGETFESNGSVVNAEPILDFEDDSTSGGVSFTLTNDAGNHRMKVKGHVDLTSGAGSVTIGQGTTYNPTGSYAQVSGSAMGFTAGLNLISITVRSDFGGSSPDDVFSYTLYDNSNSVAFGPVVQASNPDSSATLNPIETNDVTFIAPATCSAVELRGKTNGSGGSMLILGGYVLHIK